MIIICDSISSMTLACHNVPYCIAASQFSRIFRTLFIAAYFTFSQSLRQFFEGFPAHASSHPSYFNIVGISNTLTVHCNPLNCNLRTAKYLTHPFMILVFMIPLTLMIFALSSPWSSPSDILYSSLFWYASPRPLWSWSVTPTRDLGLLAPIFHDLFFYPLPPLIIAFLYPSWSWSVILILQYLVVLFYSFHDFCQPPSNPASVHNLICYSILHI